MAFRSRRGIVVPPERRPRRTRRAARVIVRAPDAVLLLRDTDPGLPGISWWVTPGGGIDEGESEIQAAVRELAEETGWQANVDDLIGPIAHRVVTHGYSDQILIQEECFYAVDVPERFVIDHANFTEEEKLGITGSGWFTLPEVANMWVWPRQIGELFAADGQICLDLGSMEESTVPLDGGMPQAGMEKTARDVELIVPTISEYSPAGTSKKM